MRCKAGIQLIRHCIRVVAIVAALLGAATFVSNAQPITSITTYSFSNDGKFLAFAASSAGVGLYDWRAEKLIKIDRFPIFATGGKSFLSQLDSLGASPREFGIFDLGTLLQTSSFKTDCDNHGIPVFQPGDKAVLMVVADGIANNHLCLQDIETGRSQIVLPKEQGFFDLHSLNFIHQDEILFIGRSPKDPEIVAKIKNLGINPVTATIPYRLKFGGRPEIAFPEILERSRALLAPLQADGPTEILVSRNGGKIVYVDRSLSEEARVREARKHPRQYEGAYRYDLFSIEEGVTRQVTRLEAFLGYPAVSYDGSIGALGLSVGEMTKEKYFNRRLRSFEPVIVDMGTGAITQTNLIARINADPQFGVK